MDFTSHPPTGACFLPGSITKVTGGFIALREHANYSVEDVISHINHTVLNIRQGDEQHRCDDFPNSMVGTKTCGDCLTPVCFEDQLVPECSELVTEGEWFVHGHIEVGAGAGFALLLSEFKIWCMILAKRSATILERARSIADNSHSNGTGAERTRRNALPIRGSTTRGHVVRAAFINSFCIDA